MTQFIDYTRRFNPQKVMMELYYANYKFNRTCCPEITPERWQSIGCFTPLMEIRYQREKQEGEQCL
jgi:hypothetical protein